MNTTFLKENKQMNSTKMNIKIKLLFCLVKEISPTLQSIVQHIFISNENTREMCKIRLRRDRICANVVRIRVVLVFRIFSPTRLRTRSGPEPHDILRREISGQHLHPKYAFQITFMLLKGFYHIFLSAFLKKSI